MSYIGALRALKEFDVKLSSIAGSSVGAVFAAFVAVGYHEDEIKKMFLDFNFNMFRDLNINIFNTDISISKGEIFLDWLRDKIGKKFYQENYENQKVYFKDLATDLQILTLDINTNTPCIFSKTNTPDEEIAFAVRASASLPGLMKPVSYNNCLLVDGDLIKSWPAWKIYTELNNENSRILEFRLEGSRDGSDLKNPIDFVNSIINTIWYLSTENVFNSYSTNDRYDYVVIDAKDVILFDFTIDSNIKESLIEKGYKETKKYLSKTLVLKKKTILYKYEKILSMIKLVSNYINQNDAKNLMFYINEILSNMEDDTKYIDVSIYEKIKELKEYVNVNTKKHMLFSLKLENSKFLKNKNEFIKMLLEQRIIELKNYINFFSNKS